LFSDKTAQVWALEVIVSITVFIVVFVFVLSLVSFTSRKPLQELQSETVALATAVTNDPVYAFILMGKVDKERFAGLAEMDYEVLKRELGLKNDFCIYIEDAQGNIIPVRYNGKNYTAIGNGSEITIGGAKCGE
jgi:hypothetical protein